MGDGRSTSNIGDVFRLEYHRQGGAIKLQTDSASTCTTPLTESECQQYATDISSPGGMTTVEGNEFPTGCYSWCEGHDSYDNDPHNQCDYPYPVRWEALPRPTRTTFERGASAS